jgi:hypothetical protein
VEMSITDYVSQVIKSQQCTGVECHQTKPQ